MVRMKIKVTEIINHISSISMQCGEFLGFFKLVLIGKLDEDTTH